MAPDPAAAGRKHANLGIWKNLGQNPRAAWGECQGSTLYQVKADLEDGTTSCSCPSRKFPCKHGLGLLLLTVGGKVGVAEPPPWVNAWLEKRTQAAEKRQARTEAAQPLPSPGGASAAAEAPSARTRSADQRLRQVAAGLDNLDLWLQDLARHGLAGLELKPASFWEHQAARLVDAKAPGLAGRVRRMASIPGSGPEWPTRLLDELGRIALLVRAFEGLEALDPLLQADVKSLIGWTLKEEEVAAQGKTVRDQWIVLGQRVEEIEGARPSLRSQRSWLRGTSRPRTALVLQFAVMGRPFTHPLIPGATFDADLAFWPSAAPQRAFVLQRHGPPRLLEAPLDGTATIDAFLESVAQDVARNPWLEAFACVLTGVAPIRGATGSWEIVDHVGRTLPLSPGDHWKLLALSGGMPVDLAGEWTGEALLPLGVMTEGAYHLLGEAA
ncbi:MAG TPA: SWIM zinc finger family protein [Chloroflexota bacterium]|nr:SWIM zinc finger family protein [Chloroflexota bacterium]